MGYLNHDLVKHRPEIDMAFDLEDKHWYRHFYEEIDDFQLFEEIRAFDVIEHLNDPINFMDNCWNLLKPHGLLKVKACGWQNPNFHVDITHKHAFDLHSFDYFDPSTDLGQRYGYYSLKKWCIVHIGYDRHYNVLADLEPIKT
jgi:hypothetical protein